MNNKKKICIVSGSRADYSYLKPIIKKINESNHLELLLIITGVHLLDKFGNTVEEIKKDGFLIKKIVPMYNENESNKVSLGRAIGYAIQNFTDVLFELNPDVLLVLGDRYEPLAAVIASSTLSIPIAHIHGGDNVFMGQIDEQIRHSLTKFAHIHFPATKKSYERIKLLGEEEWRIHLVGSPTIDEIISKKFLNKKDLCKKFELDPSEKIILCLQHPYTLEADKAGVQMRLILEILEEFKFQTIVIYPNNDPGNNLIIEEIEKVRNKPKFKVFKNVNREDYLNLLANVDLMIGNSSGGLIESPIFHLPVVNIGDRNRGRESAENVINVPPLYKEIYGAILRGLSDEFKSLCKKVENPYGDGKASERIVKILEKLLISEELLKKKLTYNV